MILFFGWRIVLKTIGRGTFHCPRESADRGYRLRAARRWFHVFWVPIVPLRQLGEVVECDGCSAQYGTDALRTPTAVAVADSIGLSMRMVIAELLRASAPVSTLQRTAALAVLQRYQGSCSEADLDLDVRNLDTSMLQEHLGQVAPVLNDLGREALVGNAAWVAVADGALNSTARMIIENMGADLSMTPAHVRGVIDSVLDAAVSRGNG